MESSHQSTANQQGVTIVELIVVIVLFGLLMPVIGLSIQTLDKINRQTKIDTEIHRIIGSKIENLRAQPFDQISNGTTDFSSDIPSSIPQPHSASYTVSDNTDTPPLKNIDIVITYGASGSERSYSYRTFVGPGG